ncbi:transcription elongation factor SPT4 isoform X1 [Synchiropus splendidus]|uniref:transcription elongation factor SPT4 isoform X1 n=1 Tax=Synchiropus splendidus TaxID=270530 RepID=UPI00237E7F51|nr:transcription elongation factor SPT4 isoform X1 [Synchiropus splendidus]XP_053728776.1 transcription elongation factor SPT4 isoform X1 [Synchiropus splendidus]
MLLHCSFIWGTGRRVICCVVGAKGGAERCLFQACGPAFLQIYSVYTIDQFEYDGCDNCESFLQMKGNREMVYECTSSSFDGVIAQMSPEDSWVAKWQRIGNFKPGVYAVSVTGRLPPGVVRELKSRGVIYKSRDTAVKT